MDWSFLATFFVAYFLALAITSSSSNVSPTSFSMSGEKIKWMYEEWLVLHDKSYSDPRERMHRYEIFKENLCLIDEHNRLENITYTLGLNQFSDLTFKEFASNYLHSSNDTYERLNSGETDRYMYRDGDFLPQSIDWRSLGAVGIVKDQGRCKCCWAFAAIAAIEGINQITTGELIMLSEQQILDCEMNNIGCSKSGQASLAYEYVVAIGGVDTYYNYPYQGKKKNCMWNSENAVEIIDYEFIPRDSELSLQKGVASQPISVVVGARCIAFQFYKSGIFNGQCGGELRHNMVVVGFSNDIRDDYWIVRNSWGEKWGEGGYIRMRRNVDDPAGLCGITTYASYPITMYGSLRS